MKIIGVMSGTSADGIDLALVDISGQPPSLQVNVLEMQSIGYDSRMRARILDTCQQGTVNDVCQLNFDLGKTIAQAILDTFTSMLHSVDLIASHGQTIWHQVNQQGDVTSTLQIGSGAVIAERTGITTVNNFRERDVAAGGHGAPLTAYVDWLLLRHGTEWRAVQNIGGMGNVSFLPPLNHDTSHLIAFDTGPGNVLIDAAINILTDGRQTYDNNGEVASGGRVNNVWLSELLQYPYFQQQPPRTTGRELFGQAMAASLVQEGRQRGESDANIIATLTAFTAASIEAAYQRFAPAPVTAVILGGGGVKNQTLFRMLVQRLAPAKVITHEDVGLNSEFKEALAFAVLGYETLHQRPGTLPSQTGARHSSILGQITPGQNYISLLRGLV